MSPTMRKAVFTIATIGGLAACASDTPGQGEADRRKRDAGTSIVDSATTTSDAATSTADASTSSGGSVSCYTEGAPTNSCTLPVPCCFSNYSAQHDGFCTTDGCTWGTIDCDGPEDCATGEHCCSSQLRDTSGAIIGYQLACQSNACGAPPTGEELCHTSSTCSGGTSCVSAYGVNNDLPRTLDICR